MKTMKVVIPGVLTTVQDLGRFGYQKSGMTCSGVMDTAAYRKANYLVGNEEGCLLYTSFMNWCVTSDLGTKTMADDMGFVIPFKGAQESQNLFVKQDTEYTACLLYTSRCV